MDLTLAYVARSKLEESKKKVTQWQTVQLSHQCRKAKEILLNETDKDSVRWLSRAVAAALSAVR
jgi:hypothetical protein